MSDFLTQFKKLQPITIAKSGKTMTGKEIFFMIRTGENDTFIIPVDKKLKPVEADYHYYSGDTAQLLRSIDSIKEEMAFQISWDESEATDVSLSQNPHLLYQLIRCKNLIDEKGHAISVHPDTSVLQLVLKKFGRNIEPHFIIAAKNSPDAEEYDGAKKYEANKLYFSLLSDSFVLSDNVIYPIAPIGDNYQQLSYFTTRFTEDMLEEYLSVFFSFIENVQVTYEDYIVERFQNDPQCRVMLMTLKTGGVGLNLTAADTVFIFEPWWNKAAEEQAINRLHRFGQKAKVLSYSLITQQTIEEKIQLLQQQKAELFEGLIGADSSSSKHLSEDDINFILG